MITVKKTDANDDLKVFIKRHFVPSSSFGTPLSSLKVDFHQKEQTPQSGSSQSNMLALQTRCEYNQYLAAFHMDIHLARYVPSQRWCRSANFDITFGYNGVDHKMSSIVRNFSVSCCNSKPF